MKNGHACARLIVLTLFSLITCGIATSQPACLDISSAVPCIDKVDPPNWWANLPSPMLLVHGNHLSDTQVAVTGCTDFIAALGSPSATPDCYGSVTIPLASDQVGIYLVR